MVDKVVQADHQVLVKVTHEVSLMVGVVSGLGLAYKNGLYTINLHCNHLRRKHLVVYIKEAHATLWLMAMLADGSYKVLHLLIGLVL